MYYVVYSQIAKCSEKLLCPYIEPVHLCDLSFIITCLSCKIYLKDATETFAQTHVSMFPFCTYIYIIVAKSTTILWILYIKGVGILSVVKWILQTSVIISFRVVLSFTYS